MARGVTGTVCEPSVSGSRIVTLEDPWLSTKTRAPSAPGARGPTTSVGWKPTGTVEMPSVVELITTTELSVSLATKTRSPTTAGWENV